MAAYSIWSRRLTAPTTVALVAGGVALYPKRKVFAEEPTQNARKPIYDTPEDEHDSSPPPSIGEKISAMLPSIPPPADAVSPPAKLTPTDHLARRIRSARLQLHRYAESVDNTTDRMATQFFTLERNVMSTLASLAPPPEVHEAVLPGSLYVLIAALSGSILTRNRNILLRASMPLALGIGTAYVVLPHTTKNVEDLVWKYEQRYPVVADTHSRIAERTRRFFQTGKAHSQMALAQAEDGLQGAKESVEGWIRKGK